MCCMVTLAMLFMFLLGSGQSYELPGPGTLRSLKKNVTGSSQHPEIARFALSFAVDGSTSRDSSLCRCCASTHIQNDPWIQIDLGRLYRVQTVEVIGRTDFNDAFNMAIFVSTAKTIWQGNTPTQPTLPDVPEQYHNVTFSYPVIGQFVTLQLKGFVDCSNGTYGLYCNETCGQCQDRETCDFVTGRCTRCLPGYQLPFCTESTLRSRNANVTGSSQYTENEERFNLFHAVDGSTSMDPIACNCCAATAIENQPWIQIDLGRLYRVSNIEVIGRLDTSKPFVGMHIYIHTQKNNWTKTNNLQLTIPNLTEQVFISVFNYPVIGQYVTLQLPDDNVILLVCEVSIYSNECLPGSFGFNCSSNCHCQNSLTCDHVNGSCPSGKCDLGWHGSNCSQRCLAGRFGDNCSSSCHCLSNQTCDPVTGMCPGGKCARGWEGTSCSNALISLNANVDASSVNSNSRFALSRAVDGSTSMNSTACKCCASTNMENQPWIQINLGRQYRVATVEVASRTDWQEGVPFAGMKIYLHEKRENWTPNHALVQTIPEDGSRKYTATFDNPVIAQYVTLQTTENNVMLVVCEVSVFSSDCRPGTYGLYCNETCGQCRYGEICNHVTGICARCLPGYQFPLCRKVCPPGKFGHDCADDCNCHKNKTCDHVTGECPDNICDFGWMGSNCSTECDSMTYGNNCAEECGHCYEESCDRRTGECRSCSDGYTGPRCMEGTIHLRATEVHVSMSSVHAGMDATKAIDGHLVDDPEICKCCSETTYEYRSWWQVDLGRAFFLKQVIVYGGRNDIICPVHTHGRDCTPCGPCKNGSCDLVTGDCPSGCYDGYDGNRCEKLTFHKCENNAVINGVIGVGVGVVTSFLVVGLIVAVLRYKKLRIRIYEEPSVRWAIGQNNESAYATLENQEVVIGKI